MKNNTDIPDDLYYLDDNFSVRSLRKYQLKEILTAHNIPYLQTITRVDLINLFKKHIEPRREEILRQYKQKELEEKQEEKTEAYGRGHRATHKPVKFEDEVLAMPAPRRRQKTTTSTDVTIDNSAHQKDKDGFAIPSLPKREPAPSFNAEDSFAEEEEEELTHKHNLPKIAPKKPSSSKKPAAVATSKKPSSSKKPTEVTTTKGPSSSKKPTEAASPKSPNKKPRAKFSPPSFNAEDSFAEDDDNELENQRTVKQKSPVVTVRKEEDEEEEDTDYHADGDDTDDDEDIGEVDKEELVLLYKDQSVPPEEIVSASVRSHWKARLTRIAYIFCTIYLVVGLIGLGITAYARNKNGYCQNYAVTPTNSNSLSSIFFSQLPSPCIPCPDHGVCVDGELTCDTLYERKTPIYNIGHLLPIGDDCIHNSVLGKYVSKVERKIKNKLALLQGEAACKHLLTHPESDEPVPIARIAVKTVLADLKAAVEPFVPADKVDEIMVIALTSVLEDPKVHYWEIDNERYLGTDNVQYTLLCQMKRLYNTTPLNIKLYILSFISALSAFIGASRDYRKNMLYKQKINNLVKATINELKKQYENHLKDPKQYPSPAVSVSQLRSSIVDVNNSKTIQDWHNVVEKIEHHPMIRKSFQEVRGDPVEYWELTA